MNSSNKLYQSLILLLSVTIIFVVLSTVDISFELLGTKTKKINLLSDVLSQGILKVVPMPNILLTDSIIAKDSIAFAIRKKDPSNILDFETDSASSLSHFFKALNQLKKTKKGKARIAYFGDSMIEGDLISQDFRGFMQDYFGGNGVGYVPITSIVSGFRTSIHHTFGDWTTYNLIDPKPIHSLGIAGYCFVPIVGNSSSWVKYSGVSRKHLDKFYQTKLLYGKSAGENNVLINGKSYALSGQAAVNQITIESISGLGIIEAKFQCKTAVDVFGFSMESDNGVFVDNFSFRGNSGMPLTNVSQNVYASTDNCLDGYDLIILEYGLNAVSPKITDFSWYEKGMLNVVNHIKSSFPKASILIISVGDKAYRNNGVYETDPSVPLLIDVQKKLAQKTNTAFWSLYDAMGGKGSIIKWVDGDTVYANKDYTHFNFNGSHRVGKLLFTKLMSEYSDYNRKNK